MAEEKIKVESGEDAEKIEVEKDVLTEIPTEEELEEAKYAGKFDAGGWQPKTSIGRKVKDGTITSIDEVLDRGQRILETEIVDALLPGLQTELLLAGQAKGKFGGGQKRVFMQTQKKTPEGNKPSFTAIVVVGNCNGYVGAGRGKSKDTVPAREKAIKQAKLNVFKIRRGCGSWQCSCQTPHSIPFAVEGKCGSVRLKLIPAPKGKGLCMEPECAKILHLAGIRDVWSSAKGQTRVKKNMINACIIALKKLVGTKISAEGITRLGIVEGGLNKNG